MKANYGVDAPGVVRTMLIVGGLCVVAALVFRHVVWLLYPGTSMALTGLIMATGSKVLKLKLRDRLIEGLQLRGDEQVLDVGCGRGLMLIGAAKHLTTGKATGIDLWRSQDQSGNDQETTIRNASAENVADKIAIVTGDMTDMPFPDNSFDVVLSSWAIHNVPTARGRANAIEEVMRVAKPGAKIAIYDLPTSKEYVATLNRLGAKQVKKSRPNFLFVMPSYLVTATK